MRVVLITDTFLPKIDGIVTTICHVLDHLVVGREVMVSDHPVGRRFMPECRCAAGVVTPCLCTARYNWFPPPSI